MLGSLATIRLSQDLNLILIYATPVKGFLLEGYTYYHSLSSVPTKSFACREWHKAYQYGLAILIHSYLWTPPSSISGRQNNDPSRISDRIYLRVAGTDASYAGA